MQFYMVVDSNFYNRWNGYRLANNVLGVFKTIDNTYVVAPEAMNTFKAAFDGLSFPSIQLDDSAFAVNPNQFGIESTFTLSDLINSKIGHLKASSKIYIENYFDHHEIFAMYNQTSGILIGAWISGVMAYVQTLSNQIKACTDVTQLNAINWNFAQFDSSIPNIEIKAMDHNEVLNMKDRDFGTQVVVSFATANELAGITTSGKTFAVLSYAGNLSNALQSGSLSAAITMINGMIADASAAKAACAPFITNEILIGYKHMIQTYLGLPND